MRASGVENTETFWEDLKKGKSVRVPALWGVNCLNVSSQFELFFVTIQKDGSYLGLSHMHIMVPCFSTWTLFYPSPQHFY